MHRILSKNQTVSLQEQSLHHLFYEVAIGELYTRVTIQGKILRSVDIALDHARINSEHYCSVIAINVAIRDEEAYAWLNSDNDNQGSVVAEKKLFPATFIYLAQQCMSPHKYDFCKTALALLCYGIKMNELPVNLIWYFLPSTTIPSFFILRF